ncbi:hypothetical protein [Arthrobacter dokdonensis]|uniref:hypothetical protein n=1 Tax=Arthrobacter dokdonellae TaxID=2211210 RepID=UPI001013C890|nr:hypothetical protein [Arthrobacter dokdonellae]
MDPSSQTPADDGGRQERANEHRLLDPGATRPKTVPGRARQSSRPLEMTRGIRTVYLWNTT